ncbi:MAG: dUTP diphosphatase [Nitrospirae bacterium]|nr:dUTP diphosphatase [Nitrospirota bacterium]
MRKVIYIKRVGEKGDGPLPSCATPGSAGLDLRAAIKNPVTIPPGGRHLVPSGIAVDIKDPEIVGIVASRSGLSLKHGIRVAQGIGVIDSDYHGEIGVILANDGTEPYTVVPGDRIAQLLFMPVILAELRPVEHFFGETSRGEGGFGHTGKS